SLVLATQFSVGRAWTTASTYFRKRISLRAYWRSWLEERRRDRERQQIVEKHARKAGADKAPEIATKAADAAATLRAARAKASADARDDEDDDEEVKKAPRAVKPPAIKRA